MPYDEVIPDEYAAGRIEQVILIMKLLFFGSPILGIFLYSLGFVDGKGFLAILLPMAYVGLTGIPSLKTIKEKSEEIAELMLSSVNAIPFLTLLYFEFPEVYREMKKLPGPLGSIIILLGTILASSLYYRFASLINENGVFFVLLMMFPTAVLSALSPIYAVYLLVLIPPLLLRSATERLRKSQERKKRFPGFKHARSKPLKLPFLHAFGWEICTPKRIF
ncbi:hypothetical protein E3E26_04315 [Thermococcus sp. LS1]|uniref:hypothetical protein n=1 Tax=Thermococcus sp. LS1 TaxID=1638259 RepID=UPI00143AA92D|nr:hypothetical protein [Thermococcus sp. LS1]NJD99011.1 hypothetical protein [Thermococcus sp. LS1]